MRSFGRSLLAAALVLGIYLPVGSQTSSPEGLYNEVVSREMVLRREINARKASAPTMPLVRRGRILIGTYEDIARLFPASDQGDKALWKGAMLAADMFWEFGDGAEKTTALRVFDALATRYPTSPLSKQVAAQTSRLGAAVPSAPQSADTRTAPSAVPAAATSATPPAGSRATPTAVSPPRVAVAAAAPSVASQPSSSQALLKSIRREILPGALRVTLEIEREASFQDERLDGPPRVFIDLENTRTVDALKEATLAFPDDVVRQIRVGRQQGSRTRVVLDLAGAGRYSAYALYNPYRVVIDFERLAKETTLATQTPPATKVTRVTRGQDLTLATHALPPIIASPPRIAPAGVSAVARPADAAAVLTNGSPTPTIDSAIAPSSPNANSTGGFSLSRQLGLGVARIVIDPGHGGHDPGAQVMDLSEADLVLDVALRLEKLLLKRSGVEVVMVRRTNVFVPLEERTAIANRESADLFLSIHANASGDDRVRGVETYFLNFAPNPQAEAIAARENAGSAKTMRSLPDIVKAIALNNKIDESRDFATLVQASMVERLKKVNKDAKNLGVKQAPFMVLIGATMPSVLAEISFVTHRQEASLLRTQSYRQQIAEALLNGVMRYQKSLKAASQLATQ